MLAPEHKARPSTLALSSVPLAGAPACALHDPLLGPTPKGGEAQRVRRRAPRTGCAAACGSAAVAAQPRPARPRCAAAAAAGTCSAPPAACRMSLRSRCAPRPPPPPRPRPAPGGALLQRRPERRPPLWARRPRATPRRRAAAGAGRAAAAWVGRGPGLSARYPPAGLAGAAQWPLSASLAWPARPLAPAGRPRQQCVRLRRSSPAAPAAAQLPRQPRARLSPQQLTAPAPARLRPGMLWRWRAPAWPAHAGAEA
jgi:hypothetical protein